MLFHKETINNQESRSSLINQKPLDLEKILHVLKFTKDKDKVVEFADEFLGEICRERFIYKVDKNNELIINKNKLIADSEYIFDNNRFEKVSITNIQNIIAFFDKNIEEEKADYIVNSLFNIYKEKENFKLTDNDKKYFKERFDTIKYPNPSNKSFLNDYKLTWNKRAFPNMASYYEYYRNIIVYFIKEITNPDGSFDKDKVEKYKAKIENIYNEAYETQIRYIMESNPNLIDNAQKLTEKYSYSLKGFNKKL
jgi:hypothetical protein